MNKRNKKGRILDKNKIPVFDSDQDLLNAFTGKKDDPSDSIKRFRKEETSETKNRHGITVLNTDYDPVPVYEDDPENFETLLEASFKKKKMPPSARKDASPVPLKKRLKRYPGVERTLDLHGYNTLGARLQAESFITSCKQQGYFTIRIVVGKGTHSPEGPVLPDVIEAVVQKMKQQELVLSYSWEKRSKSRSGAIIIYIKQFDRYD